MTQTTFKATQPAQQRGRETRESLLKAALHEFSVYGYETATVRGIAERAGESLGSIRYYFGGKDNLWREAMDRHFTLVAERFMRAVASSEDPEQRLRAVVTEFVKVASEHPEQMQMLIREGQLESSRMKWLAETHLKPMFGLFTHLMGEAVTLGIAPNRPIVPLYYAFIGATSLLFTTKSEYEIVTSKKDFGSQELLERQAELIIELFLPGLMSSGKRKSSSSRGTGT